ncbi:PfkB family carbohydrate kinase [Roseicitreum antarcticum]|uniref:Sugar or nucleoside kinase, ribokinase family n=1 Tax=Roseicitreum antarcticum TaxID=564137 RepID=A0A1H3BGY0_9RHOB|nr:PfkB family carbohydrate kinase [Roseicitreum antarcticum]SDX41157.1 Sugar or nucleoside kinase, ribokinase family [Roseicitreum antarcticum]
MTGTPDILCIGAVLWDVLGRAPTLMQAGDDVPGRITRAPGGVALNIAATLAREGLRPALLGVVGRDTEGTALIAACDELGLDTRFLYYAPDMPTDRYMAIEGDNGLIAAIADAHALEAAGAQILQPLGDGTLGSAGQPYPGLIVLDGNLTVAQLTAIATSVLFSRADLRVAAASPGKAARLTPLLAHPRATIYVNLAEARVLCNAALTNSADAARALNALGAARVVVTDGAHPASDALRGPEGTRPDVLTHCPPQVRMARVTGAGDTFMAAHIAAERRGADRPTALLLALQTAARHVATGLTA